jgi:IS5 family transposase
MLRRSYYETFGRPAKELEMMFKIMFLKQMYDMSDEVLVENLGYNMAFKYFIGLAPEDNTIDPSLLTKFRKMRITEDILEEMLREMKQAIEKDPYIMSIENRGQHPSFQVFYELVTLFDISVDQFFFPHKDVEKSTRRRQLDSELDKLDETDLIIVAATAKGIQEAKGKEGE